MPKKVLSGTVVANRMSKTVVVEVKRFVKHPRYKKYITRSKRYLTDTGGKIYEVGAPVKIEECRPLSRRKHFVVVEKP